MKRGFLKEETATKVWARLKNKDNIDILDVREHDEWRSGHIPHAKHIPLGEIPFRHHEINPKRETIVVCRSGNRSGKAVEYLSHLGYNVVNMRGGMLSWTGTIERD